MKDTAKLSGKLTVHLVPVLGVAIYVAMLKVPEWLIKVRGALCGPHRVAKNPTFSICMLPSET